MYISIFEKKMRIYSRTSKLIFIFIFGFGFGFFFGFLVSTLFSDTSFNDKSFNLKLLYKKNPNSDVVYTKCNYKSAGPRILCAVLTTRSEHSKIHYVHNTWAKRCDTTIYLTGPKDPDQKDDPEYNFVYINITNDHLKSTEKTLEAFKFAYDNLLEEFDWFVRADDDTYIIMENLKLFLADKCPEDLKIYGKTLKYGKNFEGSNTVRGYIHTGSGLVVSREALKLFAKSMNIYSNFCADFKEELNGQTLSDCFKKINIYPGETRDEFGRERFFMDPFYQLWEQPSPELQVYSLNPIKLVNIFYTVLLE